MFKRASDKAKIHNQITDYEQDLEYLEKQKHLYNDSSRVPVQLEMDIEIIQRRIEQLHSKLEDT